ncbi:MAG: tetratricopeptide repeat protein [Candidatus Marinimicrobia bacterium]|nr:tetratricopeptide repeat protein [Candidatus Neomarinimicrobiota bacterium]MCH7954183.1 tetratricopeptide repeat protein [Candidatus Neomarinimicrobiota bacterium]
METLHNKSLQAFLENISLLANKYCGRVFANKMRTLRTERERLLNNNWRKLPPDALLSAEKQEIFRVIDFDTIVLNASGYLKEKDYVVFLYDVSETAISFSEMERAQRLLHMIVTKLKSRATNRLLAKAHQRLGDISFYRNNWVTTLRQYKKSLDLFTKLKNNEGMAHINSSMGSALVEQGEVAKGEKLLVKAKAIAKRAKLVRLLAKIDVNLGNVFNMRGMWNEALVCYKESLSLIGRNRDDAERAKLYINMAIVYKARGEYDKALEYFQRSIKFSTKANDLYYKGLSYLGEADLYCRKGDLAAGTALATTAFRIFSGLGDRLSVAEVYKVFGIINRQNKRYDTALSYFENSKRINEEYDNPLNLGETMTEMAKLYGMKGGETDKARESANSAISCFKRIHADVKVTEAKEMLAAYTA